MKINIMALLLFTFLIIFSGAKADTGKITIMTPANNAMVNQQDDVELSYEVDLGSLGNNIHLFIDGWHEGTLRQLKGKANLGTLKPGPHTICLTVNTKEQAPTGIETCVEVTSK